MKRYESEERVEVSAESLILAQIHALEDKMRVMGNAQHFYREETRKELEKQDQMITVLQREQDILEDNLSKMQSPANMRNDAENARKLAALLEKEQAYLSEMKEEKENIRQLNLLLSDLEKKIAIQDKKLGGTYTSNDREIAELERKRRILDGRLYKANSDCSVVLVQNRELRARIDHLRMERELFNKLSRRLEAALENTQAESNELVTISSSAFEQRFEARSKMLAIQERSQKDDIHHCEQMKTLQRTIDHDNIIKKFMAAKNSERAEYKAEELANRTKLAEEHRQHDKNVIDFYESSISKIRDVTGEEDIPTIAAKFTKNGEVIFALFKHVNEVNAEIEDWEDEVEALQQQMAEFKKTEGVKDVKHEKIFQKLEAEYNAVHNDAENTGTKLSQLNKDLEQLKSGLNDLFKLIDCDPSSIEILLGGVAELNNKNVMMFMGLIEQKTFELLQTFTFKKVKARELQSSITGEIVIPKPPVYPEIHIAPPELAVEKAESDDEEEEECLENRPLTKQEIRQRLDKNFKEMASRGEVPGSAAPQDITLRMKQAQAKRKKSCK